MHVWAFSKGYGWENKLLWLDLSGILILATSIKQIYIEVIGCFVLIWDSSALDRLVRRRLLVSPIFLKRAERKPITFIIGRLIWGVSLFRSKVNLLIWEFSNLKILRGMTHFNIFKLAWLIHYFSYFSLSTLFWVHLNNSLNFFWHFYFFTFTFLKFIRWRVEFNSFLLMVIFWDYGICKVLLVEVVEGSWN